MIQKNVKTLDEVSDKNLHPHYTANEDGTFTLGVEDTEGAALKGQLDTAKRQTTAAKAKLTEATTRLEAFSSLGKTPEELTADLEALETGAFGNKEDADKRIREAVARQLAPMQKDHATQLKAKDELNSSLTTSRDSLLTTVNSSKIRDALHASLSGVATAQNGAMTDIENRALATFQVNPETGAIEAFEANGDKKFSKTASGALGMDEYVSDLVASSPFLFQVNAGGGAKGSGNGATPRGARIVVNRNDPVAMGTHRVAIANGTATVV